MSYRWRPVAGLILALAVLSLAQPTGFRGLDRVAIGGLPLSSIQNLFILGAAVLAGLVFGARRWFYPVLLATSLMLVMTFTVSSRLEWLTPIQSVRTFFALSLAPFLFEVRIPASVRRWIQRVVPWFALINLALGLLLYLLVGRWMIRVDWGAIRLAGTIVPAGMAMLGLVGLMFSLLTARDRPRFIWLAALNYAIVVWTGTRSGMVTGAVLCYAWIASEWLTGERRSTFRQRVALALLVPLAAASYSPFMARRLSGFWADKNEAIVLSMPGNENGFGFDIGGDAPSDIDSSSEDEEEGAEIRLTMTGRLSAWRHYYALAEENLCFGRGLGAGVVGGRGALGRAFKLPHNEYLRLLVDGGVVGLAAMLVAYLWTFWALFRRSTWPNRILLIAAFLVLAMEAALTNVLAVQSFVIPFWLYLAALRHDQEVHGPAVVSDR